MEARFLRLAEQNRRPVRLIIDGAEVQALEGDMLLTVLMLNIGFARLSDFGDGKRAGFCFMGACQDCWVWTREGERLRSCSVPVAEGMEICTTAPEGLWPIPA
ncbi:(2Fe-2S)-binding protein [Rhodoligotrophos defluvii]|uniref:(2Fe-2S)-binding protein n=1 Tax=Rhodoligotrophos defluvii TaxID=2561934 RepID=UPI0010C9B4BB|nr:(2Fe-2S)-binding protein [Rhodoligotrophos defluvii]